MSFLSLIKNLIDRINDINPTRVERKNGLQTWKKGQMIAW